MPRYVDVDKAKEMWSGEHPTQIAMRRIFDDLPAADVVPRSEIEKIFDDIARYYCINKYGDVVVYRDAIEEIKNKYIQRGTNETIS